MREANTVLVIEDDFALREIIADALVSEGYSIVQARSAADGLQAAAQRPQLILLDVSVYRPDLLALQQIRAAAACQDVPLLIVTDSPAASREGNGRDAETAVGKPFDLDDLLGKVQRLITSAPQN